MKIKAILPTILCLCFGSCARWLTALIWLWLFAVLCCAYYNVLKVTLTWAWASHNNESKASLNTYFIAFSFEVRSRRKKTPIRTCIKVQQYTIKFVCFFVNAYGLFYFTLFFTLFRWTISRPGCQKKEMMMRLRQFGEINSIDVDFICAACFTVEPSHTSNVLKKSGLAMKSIPFPDAICRQCMFTVCSSLYHVCFLWCWW